MELPKTSFAIGLVDFNVGLEGGQLAVIAAAFLLTGWLRNAVQCRRWIVTAGSVAIALCGV